jgi:hypothetical protein
VVRIQLTGPSKGILILPQAATHFDLEAAQVNSGFRLTRFLVLCLALASHAVIPWSMAIGQAPGETRFTGQPAATTTPSAVLGVSSKSVAFGTPVTLTATVTGKAGGTVPTGKVTFLDGSSPLATATLNQAGVATTAASALSVGPHSLKFSYAGDSQYGPVTSSPVALTVTKQAQTISFPNLTSPVVYGVGPITLSATASSGLAVGFSATGPATVSGTKLTINGGGQVTVTASQSGNASYAAAPAVSQTVTVTPAKPSLALKSSAASASFGTQITLTATLTAPASKTPSGTVVFNSGTTALGSGVLSGGKAILATSALPAGTDSVTASYNGDTNYAPVVSPAVSETIACAKPTVKLVASPLSASWGSPVTFAVTVTGGAVKPTGSVQLNLGTVAEGAGVLVGGAATFTVTTLPVGTDTLTASYGGDANYSAAVSTAVSVSVSKAAQGIAFKNATVTYTLHTAPMTLTASATSQLPVTFSVSDTTSGNASLSPVSYSGDTATATLTITGLGTVTVTASQAGDANFAAAPNVQKTILVVPPTPNITIWPSAWTAPLGSSMGFRSTVFGSGPTPTGTITFTSKSALGTVNLDSQGTATLTTKKAPAGTYEVHANYSGDSYYAAASSTPVTITVASSPVCPSQLQIGVVSPSTYVCMATEPVTWSVDNTALATIDSSTGVLTPNTTKTGILHVTATPANTAHKPSTLTVPVVDWIIYNGYVTPNGSSLPYIFRANSDGSSSVQIVEPTAYLPVWFPDHLMFIVEPNNISTWRYDIYKTDGTLSGTNKVAELNIPSLGQMYTPSVSPDGQSMVFAGWDTAVTHEQGTYLVNLDGSGLQLLSHENPCIGGCMGIWSARFSHDGQRIVYDHIAQSQWMVFTMNSDGSNQQPLYAGSGGAFSADDTSIFFTGLDLGVYSINAEGAPGAPVQLVSKGFYPVPSPNGTSIVFGTGTDIWTASKDGSKQKKILSGSEADW